MRGGHIYSKHTYTILQWGQKVLSQPMTILILLLRMSIISKEDYILFSPTVHTQFTYAGDTLNDCKADYELFSWCLKSTPLFGNSL